MNLEKPAAVLRLFWTEEAVEQRKKKLDNNCNHFDTLLFLGISIQCLYNACLKLRIFFVVVLLQP